MDHRVDAAVHARGARLWASSEAPRSLRGAGIVADDQRMPSRSAAAANGGLVSGTCRLPRAAGGAAPRVAGFRSTGATGSTTAAVVPIPLGLRVRIACGVAASSRTQRARKSDHHRSHSRSRRPSFHVAQSRRHRPSCIARGMMQPTRQPKAEPSRALSLARHTLAQQSSSAAAQSGTTADDGRECPREGAWVFVAEWK